MWGAKPPTFLKAFPGPRGRQTSKAHPPKSGQTAFRYPALVLRAASCKAASYKPASLQAGSRVVREDEEESDRVFKD